MPNKMVLHFKGTRVKIEMCSDTYFILFYSSRSGMHRLERVAFTSLHLFPVAVGFSGVGLPAQRPQGQQH